MAELSPISKIFVAFSLLVLMGLGIHCNSDDEASLKEYYFPIEALKDGMIYEYHSKDESIPVDYWYLKTFDLDTAVYLTAQFYNEQFEVRQFSREEIVENGVMQLDNFIYETDSLGKSIRTNGQILEAAAFPFLADTTSVFLMKIKWVFQVNPESSLTLIRNRSYLGKTNYSFNNKSTDCIKIGMKELVRSTDNGDLEHEYDGFEIYSKGIGLVYYKKTVSKDFIIEYELKDRYSMEEFEKKFKRSLEVIN